MFGDGSSECASSHLADGDNYSCLRPTNSTSTSAGLEISKDAGIEIHVDQLESIAHLEAAFPAEESESPLGNLNATRLLSVPKGATLSHHHSHYHLFSPVDYAGDDEFVPFGSPWSSYIGQLHFVEDCPKSMLPSPTAPGASPVCAGPKKAEIDTRDTSSTPPAKYSVLLPSNCDTIKIKPVAGRMNGLERNLDLTGKSGDSPYSTRIPNFGDNGSANIFRAEYHLSVAQNNDLKEALDPFTIPTQSSGHYQAIYERDENVSTTEDLTTADGSFPNSPIGISDGEGAESNCNDNTDKSESETVTVTCTQVHDGNQNDQETNANKKYERGISVYPTSNADNISAIDRSGQHRLVKLQYSQLLERQQQSRPAAVLQLDNPCSSVNKRRGRSNSLLLPPGSDFQHSHRIQKESGEGDTLLGVLDANEKTTGYYREVCGGGGKKRKASRDRSWLHTDDNKKQFNDKITSVLSEWLLNNLADPYPTYEEKAFLAEAAGLTVQQVGDWMTNMRKRHLKPVVTGKKRPKIPLDYEFLAAKSAGTMGNIHEG